LSTTRTNLGSFESSLPVESLSRTFQDALFVTVELGFRYIWIDSLCIIQDDAEDWKQESLSMHGVYKYASCNISASGFPNGVEGFLLIKRRTNPVPVNMSLNNQLTEAEGSTAQNDTREGYRLTIDLPWEKLRRSPIFTRAWTLQEQLLVSFLAGTYFCPHSKFQSSRTIHFDDDQVYWECKCIVANETWPCGWLHTSMEEEYRLSMRDGTWMFSLKDIPYNDVSFHSLKQASGAACTD
jgi:hypothetical protein